MKTKLFLTVVFLTALFAVTNAQTNTDNEKGTLTTQVNNPNFVDADNDGTCDNFENRQTSGKKGQGIRKGQGNRLGQCNGQGRGKRIGNGNGKGQGRCNGQGRGGQRNFIDSNNCLPIYTVFKPRHCRSTS